VAELVEPAGAARDTALAEAGWVRCSDGLVVQANVGAAHLAGLHTPDQLIGQALAGFLTEDACGQYVLRPDGTSIKVTALRTGNGDGPSTVVFAPASLSTFSVEELLEAQRVAKLGSFVHDVAIGHTHYSLALYELLGLPPDIEDTEAQLLFRTHPEDLPAVVEFRERLMDATDDEPLELELRERDGDKTYLVRSQPVFDENGVVYRVRGIIHDITELRAPDRQRSLDRRLFEDAQRVAMLGTWAWNTTTGECVWSTMLYELFGIESRTVMTYADYLALVHPDDREWVDRTWRQLADDGDPVVCEYRTVRPDGTIRVLAAGARRSPAARTGR